MSTVTAMAAVPSDPPPRPARIDLGGAALLGLAIISLIVGLGQSQSWGWASPAVWAVLGVAVVSSILFVIVERRREQPLVDLHLLTTAPPTAPLSSASAWPAQPRWGSA